MRAFLIPVLVILVGGSAALFLILWLRARFAVGGTAMRGQLGRVLTAHGPARCIAAAHYLDQLAKREDSAAITAAWARLEMPLLEALPDCPPDYKLPLINALDACARPCRVVATARAIITMRNSLLNNGDTDPG